MFFFAWNKSKQGKKEKQTTRENKESKEEGKKKTWERERVKMGSETS